MGLRFDEPLPLVFWRTRFCSEFGWTFDQFNRLTLAEFHETVGVWEGMAKAEKAG